MTNPKNTHPALAYLVECRKKGFSCEEASSKLKKAGYSDDAIVLSEAAYHNKRQKDLFVVVSIVLLAVLLVGSVGGGSAIWGMQSRIGELEVQTMKTAATAGPQDAASCVGKPQGVREECLRYAKEVLAREETLAQGDRKVSIVAQSAAIDRDFTRCAELDGAGRTKCDYLAHELSAELSGDPGVCAALVNLSDGVRCYMGSLSRIDPARASALRDVVHKAKESGDQASCGGLGVDFLIAACVQSVLQK